MISTKIATVINAVAAYAGLVPQAFLTKDRHKSVAAARHVAIYVCRQYMIPRPSFPELGRAFGDRDHTTIMNSVRRVERLRDSDDWFRDAVRSGKGALDLVQLRPPVSATRFLEDYQVVDEAQIGAAE